MAKFNLGEILAKQADPAEVRDIEAITTEILNAKRVGGEAILTIGRCLIEAKEALPHGEWGAWLGERVEFSERTASRFMRLSREWTNRSALSDLGATKALTLLALPPEEREEFISATHTVDGEEKSVIDMSARQLEQAIKDRKDALEQLGAAQQAADDAKKSAEESAAQLEAVKKELAELKAKQVDVAVAVSVADQEMIEQAKAEAIAEVQAKLEKAKAAKAKAEDARRAAEDQLSSVREELADAQKQAKAAAMAGEKDMFAFGVYFAEAQELANKLRGVMLKFRGREDSSAAEKVQRALLALADAIKGAAE